MARVYAVVRGTFYIAFGASAVYGAYRLGEDVLIPARDLLERGDVR